MTNRNDDTTPILIGAGQVVQKDVEPATARSPLDLMVDAVRLAAADAEGGDALLGQADRVGVVNVFCHHYGNAPRALAERIGARPREEVYTPIGGNSPQMLVNDTAAAIAAGRTAVAVLAGAEALHSLARARRAHVALRWEQDAEGTPQVLGTARDGTSEYEMAHGMQMPVQIYPLFENALRARDGLGIEAHRARLGALYERFSAVAAAHPQAWFRTPRTAAEIVTVTPDNRYIGFPYLKLLNAILDVDQAAAVVMTSAGRARALGIPESRWVYLRGTADAHDHWYVTERVDYVSSPAIRAAGRAALADAGLSIERIDAFDLYSCFPCAVQIGRDMLGIPAADPRPLTVTGGLAYFGGPGNAYSMHAIATMMDRLRARPGTTGLVTALGWYLTKHAVGVYATEPGQGPWRRTDPATYQAAIDAEPHPTVAPDATGPATIETYTVLHGRDGAPLRGIVVGRLPDGRRFLADTPDDREVLESLETREGVGRPGVVTTRDGASRFDPS